MMGHSNLELFHVKEASGYQIHSNTESRSQGVSKVKSEEFEIEYASFCPKLTFL